MKRNSLVAGLRRGCLALLALAMSSGAFAAETGAVQCPSEDFTAFVKAFSADAQLQQAFTASSVIEQSVVSTGSKPRVMQRQVVTLGPRSLAELSPEQVAKSSLSVQIQLPNTVFVRDRKGEVLKLFTFKHSDCWTLVRVEDWSLDKVLDAQQGELRASPGARAFRRGVLYNDLAMKAAYPADTQLYVSALDSYLDGADLGSHEAAYAAASISLSGQAPRLDNEKLHALYTQASTSMAQASLALAGFYCDEGEYGDPRPCVDPARSLAALKTSAVQGSLYALNELGFSFQSGSLGIQDSQRALACYLTAASKGLELSQTNADALIAKGIQADASKTCLSPMRDVVISSAQAKALSCPSLDFTAFLAAYSESPALQKAFTRVPLKKLITVDAEPEPQPVKTLLDNTEIVFPLMPNAQGVTSNGLKLQIIDKTDTLATVKLEKPDTGYLVHYVFSLDGCWVLDEVQDYSL